jgi:aspartate aminotransferase-like enzyme
MPLVLAASGTGLMEAGITNLTEPGAHGLVVSHGKFGDRFAQIAQATGRTAHVLRVDDPEWGRAFTPDDIARWFRDRVAANEPRIAFVCFQQNETSSGIAYRPGQMHAIVRAARTHNPGVMIVVDAISGAFAHPIDAASLDVDLLVVGSQKGLGVSSGLAFGVLSARALDRMLELGGLDGATGTWLSEPTPDVVDRFERRQHVRYLSLLRLYRDQRLGTWEDPASVFHVLSTARALDRHERDGGPAAVLARHAEMGQLVRDSLEQAGLRPVADPSYASDSVTPAFVPEGIEAGALRKRLEVEYGIAIAGAQGDYWARRMIRIGHFGFVYPSDVARCLRAVRLILRRVEEPRHSEAPAAQRAAG